MGGRSVASQFLLLCALLWLAAAIAGLSGLIAVGRMLLALGAAVGVVAAIIGLPAATRVFMLPGQIMSEAVAFRLDPEALWLMGFGLIPAGFACALMSPSGEGSRGWIFGAAIRRNASIARRECQIVVIVGYDERSRRCCPAVTSVMPTRIITSIAG